MGPGVRQDDTIVLATRSNNGSRPCPSGYFVARNEDLRRRANQLHISARPGPMRGTLRDRHERWAGDAVDVSVSQRANHLPTNDAIMDGEIVWSWHPGADAKSADSDERAGDGGKNAGPRGDHV
jgi:hypothetical protein